MPNPFNQSDYEEKARSRQMSKPPPRRIKPILIEHCSACGSPVTLAFGYTALETTCRRKLELLVRIGWTVAPKLLCRTCACPMSPDDTLKAVRLWNKIKDGGDVCYTKDWVNFEKEKRKEYGAKVSRYFNTMKYQGIYTILEEQLR